MSFITRAKNILLSPGSEWLAISTETETPQSLLGKYVIPMSLIPAVAVFIGFGVIGIGFGGFGVSDLKWGLIMAIISFLVSILGYYISTYVADALAPSLGSEKNIGRSAQLVAYSLTAYWVAGILLILPRLTFLSLLLGLYGVYLLYMGVPVLKKVPEDKRVVYTVAVAAVVVIVGYILQMIMTKLFFEIMGGPFSLL
jgi:hypothetical protein